MPCRSCLIVLLSSWTLASGWRVDAPQPAVSARPPNFIIVYADDLGYADIGSFSMRTGVGRPSTPHLDRMAKEGIRLTSFYVAQAVCSASRAALLTGCIPIASAFRAR